MFLLLVLDEVLGDLLVFVVDAPLVVTEATVREVRITVNGVEALGRGSDGAISGTLFMELSEGDVAEEKVRVASVIRGDAVLARRLEAVAKVDTSAEPAKVSSGHTEFGDGLGHEDTATEKADKVASARAVVKKVLVADVAGEAFLLARTGDLVDPVEDVILEFFLFLFVILLGFLLLKKKRGQRKRRKKKRDHRR